MQMDNRIQSDLNIKAFLTLDEQQFNEYKQNPNSIIDKMKSMYKNIINIPFIKVFYVCSTKNLRFYVEERNRCGECSKKGMSENL